MRIHGEPRNEVLRYVSRLRLLSILVPIAGTLALCRDPDDDVLLETAFTGHATFIVSREEDVTRDLELHRAAASHGIQIVTVSRFLHQLAV